MTASHAYEWGFYNLVHMQQKISMQIFSTAAEKKIFPLRSAEDYTHWMTRANPHGDPLHCKLLQISTTDIHVRFERDMLTQETSYQVPYGVEGLV